MSQLDKDFLSDKTDSSVKLEVTEKDIDFPVIRSQYADVTLKFMDENNEIPEITDEEEKNLSRKLRWIVVPIAFFINLLLYMDKSTLSYASIMSFFADTGLDKTKYNNVNTIFYVGYIVGQFPGHYLIQKLPVGRFLTGVIFLWSLIIFLHCTAYNYAGVIVLRFFLGFTESIITPLMVIFQAMYLTAEERAALQPVFYASAFASDIPTGFIAFGVLHTKSKISAWKIFMIILGGLTFLVSTVLFFTFPNNPTDAKFLSRNEKVWTIRRVQRSTGSSIEQKVFKRYQMIEAIKDPISWLFGAFMFLLMLSNNLSYQKNLLYTGIGGVTQIKSTYISAIQACFSVVCCVMTTLFMRKIKRFGAYIALFWCVPSVVGGIAIATLPWNNKIALLANLMLAGATHGITWIIGYSWTTSSCSGYTKRLTRSVISMFCYGVANIIAPQLWTVRDAPRYIPAWAIQVVLSWTISPVFLVAIDIILRKRNKQRLQNLSENALVGYVEFDEEKSTEAVDIAALDLTDLENKLFIYPL